jgi:hypothetical protein
MVKHAQMHENYMRNICSRRSVSGYGIMLQASKKPVRFLVSFLNNPLWMGEGGGMWPALKADNLVAIY